MKSNKHDVLFPRIISVSLTITNQPINTFIFNSPSNTYFKGFLYNKIIFCIGNLYDPFLLSVFIWCLESMEVMYLSRILQQIF